MVLQTKTSESFPNAICGRIARHTKQIIQLLTRNADRNHPRGNTSFKITKIKFQITVAPKNTPLDWNSGWLLPRRRAVLLIPPQKKTPLSTPHGHPTMRQRVTSFQIQENKIRSTIIPKNTPRRWNSRGALPRPLPTLHMAIKESFLLHAPHSLPTMRLRGLWH